MAITPGTIAVTEGSGKILDTVEVTVNATTVEREVVVLGNPDATSPLRYALVNSSNQLSVSVDNSPAVTQSGNWTARIVGNAGATLDATVGAGTAPTNMQVVGAQYNSSAPAPTSGQTMALQADAAGNLFTTHGSAIATLTVWDSTTAQNTTQTVIQNNGAPIVQLDLVQSAGSFSTGAVTIQGSYDGTNYLTVPVSQLLTPSTFVQLSNPYTFVSGNRTAYLILMSGFRTIRINLTTAITGTGTVTPYTSIVPVVPIPHQLTAAGWVKTDITTIAGSAPSSAGKIDIKGQDGDVFVRQGSAGNLLCTASQGGTWNTRTQDGAGNALTSNSTTYSSKFALDINLLGTLGTAFSTAGKVDVKGADGDVFVRQATAANLNATVVFASPQAVTIADGSDTTLGAKADAKSTATDTTAISIMSVLKEISFMEQNPASQAVTNAGTFAVQATLQAGSAVIGHVVTDTGSVTNATLSAETTKVIGVTRTSDGAGNLLTSNSTTFSSKFALDANLLGTLGTAFSTAGKVDVKIADGDYITIGAKADAKSTATDTTAISIMSVLKQISASVQAPPSQAVTNVGTFAVQATLAAETTKVIGTVNQGTSPWIVGIEGSTGTSLETTAGVLDTNLKNVGNGAVVTAGAGIQLVGIVGNAAAVMDVSASGGAAVASALQVAGIYNSTPLALTTGQGAALQFDSAGNLLINVKAGSSAGTQYVNNATLGATQTGTLALGIDTEDNLYRAFTTDVLGNQYVAIDVGTLSEMTDVLKRILANLEAHNLMFSQATGVPYLGTEEILNSLVME